MSSSEIAPNSPADDEAPTNGTGLGAVLRRPLRLVAETLFWAMPTAAAAGIGTAFEWISAATAAALLGASLVAAVVPACIRRLAILSTISSLKDLPQVGVRTSGPPKRPLMDPLVYRGLRSLEDRIRVQASLIGEELTTAARVLEALPDPLLHLDEDLIVRFANAAAAQRFGPAAEGKSLARVIRDPRLGDAVREALAQNEGQTLQMDEPRARGRVFDVAVLPIQGADDTRRCLLVFRERTAERQSQRMLTDFVANASHEIRTPLTAMRGLIETLRGPARDDAAARERFLATMASETERMTRVVSELLVLSRVEMMQFDTPENSIDLREVLERMEQALGGLIADSGMAFLLETGDQPLLVRADGDQLQQVFINLVDNALKYGASGKRVEVRAGRADRAPPRAGRLSGAPAIAVTVRDYGDGIPADAIPRVTERFFRVDASRSRRLGGTGLGLAIVKHILNRHAGHLAIRSELGVGSTFTVYLPASGTKASSEIQQPTVNPSVA